MDILYLGRIFPKRASIMAKRELKWMPLLGWFSTCGRYSSRTRTDRNSRRFPLSFPFSCIVSRCARSLARAVSLSGAVFVDRKNSKDAVKAMNAAGEAMKKQGVSSFFFTPSRGPELVRPGLALDLPRGHALERARARSPAVQEGRVPSRRTRCVSCHPACASGADVGV